jgi:putative transposase
MKCINNIFITYKFRIYPTHEQETKIQEIFNIETQIYNIMIKRIKEMNAKNKKITEKDLKQIIYELKNLWENKVYFTVIYSIEKRVFGNLKGLYKLKKRNKNANTLKLKKKFSYLFYKHYGFKIKSDSILLLKIGKIKVRFHRPIEGKVIGVGIKKDKDNKWYAFIIVKLNKKPLPKTNRVVAIDWGIEKLITTSDGISIENPLIWDQLEERIKKLQRDLRRKKKGSKNYEKARMKLAKIYKHAQNLMNDYLHKVTIWLIKNYDVIYIENIKIKKLIHMTKSKKLRKHILSANYYKFLKMLIYKAKLYGKRVIKVSPKNTSKKCSRCGYINKKLSLKDRIFKCPKCGLEIDRDYNAALNILNAGLGRPKAPVEEKPLIYISFSKGVYSKFPMKQEIKVHREGRG